MLNNLSIVIPAYNSSTTLKDTLNSIILQKIPSINSLEIIVVNDGSTDNTEDIVKLFKLDYPNLDLNIINLEKNSGISYACNTGIKKAKYELVGVTQSDILFEDENTIEIMMQNLIENDLVATYPFVLHPKYVWDNYSLWQKAMFDRLVGTRSESRFAKFVLGKTKLFLQIGGYDTNLHGGEDRDVYEKFNKLGKVSKTDVNVIHIHSNEKNFSIMKLLDKEAQEADGTGASIRKHTFDSGIKEYLLIFARPFVFLTIFIPILWPITIIFIYLYTKNIYKYCYKDRNIWMVPFITIARISVYSYYLFSGLIKGKSQVRHFNWGNSKYNNKINEK